MSTIYKGTAVEVFMLPFALSLLLSLLVVPAAAAQSRGHVLISTAALAGRLDDPDLLLLHVGDRAAYDRAHIPGARFLDFHAVLHWDENGLSMQMPPLDLLHERLSALGISLGSAVVVYPETAASMTGATRAVLTLQYAGVKSVSFLDGGLEAWAREARPVTADATPSAQHPTARWQPIRTVTADADFVQAHRSKPGYVVIDARARVFYDGVESGGSSRARHKAGHIAGARSIPFNTLHAPDGRLKPVDELKRIFADAGVKPGDTIIAYCHVGLQATAVLLAASALDHPYLLYDGSFEDWSRRDLPVETSSGTAAK